MEKTHSKPPLVNINWSSQEFDTVIYRAALAMLDNNEKKTNALLLAQQFLPANRQRPESSIRGSVTKWKERLNREVDRVLRTRRELKNTIHPAPSPTPAPAPTPAISPLMQGQNKPVTPQPQQVEVSLLERSMAATTELFLDAIVEDLRAELKRRLISMTAEVVKEMSSTVKVTATAPVESEVSAITSDGVSAVTPEGVVTPVSAFRKMKVVYLAGHARVKDRAITVKGLEDVYKFNFVDSLAAVQSITDADVLVKSNFATIDLYRAAKRLNPNAFWIENQSPHRVNEILLEHFALKTEGKVTANGKRVPK